jgi:hypothetical protein
MCPKNLRNLISIIVGILSLIASLYFPNAIAQAENCAIQNFDALFYEDYHPATSWVQTGGSKTIRWTTSVSEIAGDTVSRSMTADEIVWLREAIQSWDVATTSISFEESMDESGELKIGWVPLQKLPSGAGAYWNTWWSNGIRNRATIKFGDGEAFLNNKNGFIHTARHELGNVLGLGDIRPSTAFNSYMEDPWQPAAEMIYLDDFDYGLIRQLYGESTCPSTWKSQTATPVSTSVAPTKIVTNKITCVKGKLIKRISGIRPKCPAGYKKRK